MKIQKLILSCALAAWAVGSALAHGAAGTTAVSFSSNPVNLVAGDDVTISTLTSAPDHPELIDAGTVTIQYATDGLGNPVPAANVVLWVPLNAPGQSPSSHTTALNVDLDALGFVNGTVGGFRAHYVTSGGQHRVNTHHSPGVDIVAVAGCTGVHLGATLATGNGNPIPGTYSWTFRIEIHNCDLSARTFKVQGGTNGWAPMTGAAASKGSYVVRNNNRNQVLTWTVDLAPGETQYIDVTVSGTIRPNTVDGTVLFLSGAWSATYTDDFGFPAKTDYTGRVSVTVSNP